MMAKQKKLLLFAVLLFAVLLVLYLAVIRPLVMTSENGEDTMPLDTVEGEEVSEMGQYYMFEPVDRVGIDSVRVKNSYSEYELYRDQNGDFNLKGYEGTLLVPETISEFVVAVGHPLAKLKLTDNATQEQLVEYGLAEPQASYVLTTKAGKEYTVNIGYDLLTGGGYYCMLEGRPSIYVLSDSLRDTVLCPVEDLCSPVLLTGIGSSDYYTVEDFSIMHGEEIICMIGVSDKEDFQNPNAMHENYMIYPTGYFPNSDMYLDILYYFSQDLVGTQVVKLGPDEGDFETYGLKNPARTIRFTYKETEVALFFSEKQEDGSYYAISNLFPTTLIAISGEGLEYLEYTLVRWVQSYPFQYWINMVESIDLAGSGVDVCFTLTHGTEGTGDDAKATLRVDTDTGKVIPNTDVYNFRQFYKTVMAVEIKDYAPLTEAEIAQLVTEENCILTVTVRQLNGKENTYRFYPYSSTGRRSFMTVNGKGEFYVMTDVVEKIAGDALKVLNDLDVDSYGKN